MSSAAERVGVTAMQTLGAEKVVDAAYPNNCCLEENTRNFTVAWDSQARRGGGYGNKLVPYRYGGSLI